MAIRILHTGDWHIGNYSGPEKDGVNARYIDICRCLMQIVQRAQRYEPDLIVVAGDIFHQARVWSDRGLKEQETAVYFIRELAKVSPVVVMRGTPNHDSEEQFNMLKSVFDSEAGGRVKIVTEPKVLEVETEHGDVQVACLPGFDKGVFRANNPGLSKEEENIKFSEMLEQLIIGLKAQCDAERPSILVGHYTIAGCNMESGQTAFLNQFEPMVYPSTLAAAGFDLVCFGHIHRAQKIEGCENTFYCGSVAPLNFNDEGQDRGCWIHDINGDGSVKSSFYVNNTRRFLTLRLEDEDVKAITEEGPEYLSTLPQIESGGATESIVRILYNCTDEHNKAFNHAETEKWLRGPGKAFWVSEISPEKITVTADKNTMDRDGTPEGNLRQYLEEQEMSPERIDRLMEQAIPIISEATEKATTEKKTGTLVPVEIEVKNYRNFREEKFSFEDISFCTINGENGAGKSSLFMDAILDALFEEPREGDLTGWICNDPNVRSGMIKFTFRLGDTEYRVTRTRQKRGGPSLNISELVDGEWVDRSCEKMKDTQAEIENIIGMDSLTLKSCALIMQDQYGLFLQADKEARMNILGNILGLGIYGDMEEIAAEKCTDENRLVRVNNDRIATLMGSLPDMEELKEEKRTAEKQRKESEEELEKRKSDLDSKKVALNTQREAEKRLEKLNGKRTTQDAQMAQKTAQLTAQMGTVANAEQTLRQEAEIKAGIEERKHLQEEEKKLIAEKAAYDSVKAEADRARAEAETAEKEAKAAEKKAEETKQRAEDLDKAIQEAKELEGVHKEYEETAEKISRMEESRHEWEEKKAEAEKAQRNADQLTGDRDRKIAKENARIEALKDKVRLLEDCGCPIAESATCKFLKDAQEAKEDLPKAEKEREQIEEEYEIAIQSAQELLKGAQDAMKASLYQPEEINALRASQSSRESAERQYRQMNAQLTEHTIVTQRYFELKEEAEKAAEKAETLKKTAEEKAAAAEKGSDISIRLRKLEADLAETEHWAEAEKQLPVAREKKAAAEERIEELESEISALEAEIEDTENEKEAEREKLKGKDALEEEVKAAEKQIQALTETESEAIKWLGRIEASTKRAEETIAEADRIREEVNGYALRASGYEDLKKAFSQDGIPHNIIRSIIPVFEATATNILGQMSGGKMSVELVTEKTLKSNSKKEVTTLDIIINDCDTGRLPYMSRSGGERVKAALSVILALAEIKSTKAGIQMGFLFIDEPPFLDAQGIQAYCDALEAVQRRYSDLKVMAITHDPAMKSRFPQSVDVIKTEEGSKVIY